MGLIDPKYTGPNAMGMSNDQSTPPCRLCGKEHVGVFNPAYVALRGNFVVPPEVGIEVFMLDRHAEVQMIRLNGGALGLIIDHNVRKNATVVLHEDCCDEAARKLELMKEVGEDAFSDDEELDPDYQWHRPRDGE